VSVLTDADVKIDRPVKVTGEPPAVRSKNSLLILAANKAWRLVYVFDDNILFDNATVGQTPATIPPPIALALRNALFKVTPVNGCALFGSLAEDFVKVTQGFLLLGFGVYAYLPSLPDPYAGNLGALQFQFRRSRRSPAGGGQVWMLLVCMVRWQPDTPDRDQVEVSFHFAPLPNQLQVTFAASAAPSTTAPHPIGAAGAPSGWDAGSRLPPLPDYGAIWEQSTQPFQRDVFALLDVSTNADLLGVSFGTFYDRRMAMVTTHGAVSPAQSAGAFPLQVQGMDVVSQGSNVRAFTVPQISWEPVLNLTPPAKIGVGDPSFGPNYYPDDGGPTRILNNSSNQVALAPIPLTKFIVDTFSIDSKFAAAALFTLPFGIKALALLQKQYEFNGVAQAGADVLCDPKSFRADLKGALHLRLDAGESPFAGESDTFVGSTIQINNVLELDGTAKGASTLGRTVTQIFNNEFLLQPFDLFRQRGVPLTRIDLSGYGASTFSNWLNPNATIAATSQARFEVFVGRCAHEIIQVKSILYPWGIHVVRTITLLRAPSAYTYRWDSGWRAESDGRFDFSYFAYVPDPNDASKFIPEMEDAGYEVHPGVVRGLFNIKEIKESTEILPFSGQMQVKPNGIYVDDVGRKQTNTTGADMPFSFSLQPVFFNADVEIENPISGYVTKTIGGHERKIVASKGILGFVQIEPRGMPLTTETLRDLILRQGTIGGPLDCVIDVGASGQQVRVSRFDVSNSFAGDATTPIFVAAARGMAILPKDGSWSVVKHENGTGEVTPVPEDLAVPLIRIGKVKRQVNDLVIDPDPSTQLLRIAETTEILRQPVAATVNYGFLHATDTQKALFLTPAYAAGMNKLLSKTPPLFADAFRIVNSKAIFPNIGDAVSGFGDVINLAKNGTEFVQNALTDAGNKVLEVMQIGQVVAGAKQQGFQLLKQVAEFDLPSTPWTLIELGGVFKISIEYAANIKKQDGSTTNRTGNLNYDVNTFAANLADTWKSRMSNVALVIDLDPIDRLMTIKGNWGA
jgi:hypothetical protein